MVKKLTERLDYLIGSVALLGFFLLLIEQTAPMNSHLIWVQRINLSILGLFAVDIALSGLASRERLRHLWARGLDLVVFVPLVHALFAPHNLALSVLLGQVAIGVMLLSRMRRAHTLVSLLALKPAQLMLMSFAGIIAVGSILLLMPAATLAGARTSLSGAVFTATSATCVTGLTVYDIATHFTLFGQTVILALIQIGGLGIMTFSMAFALMMRQNISLKNQSIMQNVLEQDAVVSMRRLALFIVAMTFLLEAIGSLSLFLSWRHLFDSDLNAAGAAIFHSVSAFCNAGFSTFSDNMIGFQASLPVNATLAGLIVLGGIGFVVIGDLYQAVTKKFKRSRGPRHKFRIQSRLALTWTFWLIVAGAGLFYVLERPRLLANLPQDQAWIISLFQSITTRTAGFNTCAIGALQPATLLVFIVLMFIGACPGGTGGGIKITTPATLWAVIRAGFNRREAPELYRRTLPIEVVQKAVMMLCASLLLICGATILLQVFEQKNVLDVLFETVSAFGTVGLSTGLTPELSAPGRILITLMMFIGRLGPLTVGFAFMLRNVRPAKYSYAEERIMIG